MPVHMLVRRACPRKKPRHRRHAKRSYSQKSHNNKRERRGAVRVPQAAHSDVTAARAPSPWTHARWEVCSWRGLASFRPPPSPRGGGSRDSPPFHGLHRIHHGGHGLHRRLVGRLEPVRVAGEDARVFGHDLERLLARAEHLLQHCPRAGNVGRPVEVREDDRRVLERRRERRALVPAEHVEQVRPQQHHARPRRLKLVAHKLRLQLWRQRQRHLPLPRHAGARHQQCERRGHHVTLRLSDLELAIHLVRLAVLLVVNRAVDAESPLLRIEADHVNVVRKQLVAHPQLEPRDLLLTCQLEADIVARSVHQREHRAGLSAGCYSHARAPRCPLCLSRTLMR
mmetsp:Transcript_42229/g.133320  ORF Transcript_42229/g.133320 Transcript_42229/m.133320 type:complete len:340 (-) Transcript_42229:101-1120(-)